MTEPKRNSKMRRLPQQSYEFMELCKKHVNPFQKEKTCFHINKIYTFIMLI